MGMTGAPQLVGSALSAPSVWPAIGEPYFCIAAAEFKPAQSASSVGLLRALQAGEPLAGAGCLNAYTAGRLLVFLGWPITYVASKCSNLRPQTIFCSSFLLCMFDSVALFIFLKYFLLVCVSWHAPAMIFLNAIFSDPLATYNATPRPTRMTASCLDDLHFSRLGRVLRTMVPLLFT